MGYLQSCQADLVKDGGHKYFLSVLADSAVPVSNVKSTEYWWPIAIYLSIIHKSYFWLLLWKE